MANRFIDRIIHGPSDTVDAPLGGSRREAIQRLQVGASGVIGVLLLVALADSLRDQADEADAEAVPEAVATVEPSPTPTQPSDPLVEAGVVPDLPSDPAEAAAQDDPVLPEQGVGEAGGGGEQ